MGKSKNIGKRKDSRFQLSFTFEGKRYYVYGNTKEEATLNRIAKRKQLEEKQEALYNPTLGQYYERFNAIRRNQRSECTLRAQNYQYALLSGVTMVNDKPFGEMQIKSITRHDIEYVRQALINAGKTPEHLNICFRHLNHVFNNAVLDDVLIKNPCKALTPLKRESAKAVETKHRALTTEETVRFFEVAEERNSYYINVFKLMINSGMRVGEVCALYQTDIDRKNGFIHVRRTVTRDEGGNFIIGDNTKTISGSRDIPLTPELDSILRDQEKLNRMIFGFGWSGLLFQAYKSNKEQSESKEEEQAESQESNVLRDYTINREIERICKEAGIEKITSHAFRDTFATRFIEQRPHDFKILSEILGHKDINITLNLYTHVMTEKKVLAMNDIMIKTS